MLVLAACNVQAQSSSVGELIAKSKAARTAELMGAPAKPVDSDAKKKTSSPSTVKPKLWSITGMDQNFTAVLLVQQKAYTVASHDLPVNLGAWEVTQISHQQVWLRELKTSAQKARAVVLEAPDRDTKVESYWQALPKTAVADGDVANLLANPPRLQPLATPLPSSPVRVVSP